MTDLPSMPAPTNMQPVPDGVSAFRRDLSAVINRHSLENGSNTPDFILANYLHHCLEAFDAACVSREDWYGHRHAPGQSVSR